MAKEEEDDTAMEMQDLQDEADIPIEQLLARYGYPSQAATTKASPLSTQTSLLEAQPKVQKQDKPPEGSNYTTELNQTSKPIETRDIDADGKFSIISYYCLPSSSSRQTLTQD